MTRKLFGIEIDGDSDPLTADAVQRACALGLLQSHGAVAVYDLTPEWVSVEDESRLPKDGRDVWVFAGDGEVDTGYWVAPDCWLGPMGSTIDDVTHWQERIIPEPPA